MIPSNALALIVFLVAVAPGYVYQLVIERALARRTRTALVEAIDLLCIGAFCTVVGSLVTLALGIAAPGVLLRLEDLRTAGSAFPGWRALASAVLALALSVGAAFAVGQIRVRTADQAARVRPGSVWTNTFTRFARLPTPGTDGRARGPAPLFLVLQLRDGRTIGGQLAYPDVAEDPDKRDLTLAAPLWVAEAGSAERRPQPYSFVIISAKDVVQVWGRALDPSRTNASTPPKERHGPDPIVDSRRATGGPGP